MKLELSVDADTLRHTVSSSGDCASFSIPTAYSQSYSGRRAPEWPKDKIREQLTEARSRLSKKIEDDPSLLPLKEMRHCRRPALQLLDRCLYEISSPESIITPKSVYNYIYPSDKDESRSDYSVQRVSVETRQERQMNEEHVEGYIKLLKPLFEEMDSRPDVTRLTKFDQGIFCPVDGLDYSKLVLEMVEDEFTQRLKDTERVENAKMWQAYDHAKALKQKRSYLGKLWSTLGFASVSNDATTDVDLR